MGVMRLAGMVPALMASSSAFVPTSELQRDSMISCCRLVVERGQSAASRVAAGAVSRVVRSRRAARRTVSGCVGAARSSSCASRRSVCELRASSLTAAVRCSAGSVLLRAVVLALWTMWSVRASAFG